MCTTTLFKMFFRRALFAPANFNHTMGFVVEMNRREETAVGAEEMSAKLLH